MRRGNTVATGSPLLFRRELLPAPRVPPELPVQTDRGEAARGGEARGDLEDGARVRRGRGRGDRDSGGLDPERALEQGVRGVPEPGRLGGEVERDAQVDRRSGGGDQDGRARGRRPGPHLARGTPG